MAPPDENGWIPYSKATREPKFDTDVDVWAKKWDPINDSFDYKRYVNCYLKYHPAGGGKMVTWEGVPEGWCVTHWREIPKPPVIVNATQPPS